MQIMGTRVKQVSGSAGRGYLSSTIIQHTFEMRMEGMKIPNWVQIASALPLKSLASNFVTLSSFWASASFRSMSSSMRRVASNSASSTSSWYLTSEGVIFSTVKMMGPAHWGLKIVVRLGEFS